MYWERLTFGGLAAAPAPAVTCPTHIVSQNAAKADLSTKWTKVVSATFIITPSIIIMRFAIHNSVVRASYVAWDIFESYNEIIDHCCDTWNKLIDQPARIKSIGMRQWAHEC